MALPLMPKATAVWLVENTTLTFDQIAAFCGLHPLEISGIADDEVAIGIQGLDPVSRGQLTREEIDASEADPARALGLAAPRVQLPPRRASGPRYTPVSKRQDRPNAIAWLLRFHPELSDAQISRLVGTTKPTIGTIRDRTHWNITNIRHQDPVSLGLCSQTALDEAVTKGRARLRAKEAREADAAAAAAARREKDDAAAAAARREKDDAAAAAARREKDDAAAAAARREKDDAAAAKSDAAVKTEPTPSEAAPAESPLAGPAPAAAEGAFDEPPSTDSRPEPANDAAPSDETPPT
jgi:hypothetical protein